MRYEKGKIRSLSPIFIYFFSFFLFLIESRVRTRVRILLTRSLTAFKSLFNYAIRNWYFRAEEETLPGHAIAIILIKIERLTCVRICGSWRRKISIDPLGGLRGIRFPTADWLRLEESHGLKLLMAASRCNRFP